MAELTPMMRQYLELKEENADALLFFRLGDFYEMFFDDALVASRELELTLTGRDCGLSERAPMCGVPWHAVDGYIQRLIEKGYKVAIAEQTEDPTKTKTLVKRAVVRVITPGTFSDYAKQEKQNRFLCAVHFMRNKAGAALCDVSTGEFFVAPLEQGTAGVAAFLDARAPSEVITNDEERLREIFDGYISSVSPDLFRPQRAKKALLAHFQVSHPEALGLPQKEEGMTVSAGALLQYLNNTQKVDLRHIQNLFILAPGDSMPLPQTTRRSLELTQGLRGQGGRNTLLSVLDRTRTAMGARLLRSMVENPLINQQEIERRLACVSAFFEDSLLLSEVGQVLGRVYDLERLLGKLSYGTLGPRDCLALLRTLEAAPEAQALLSGREEEGLAHLFAQLAPLPALSALLSSAISKEAPLLLSDGNVINDGFDAALDEARLAAREGRQWIADLESRERERTGIKNLRVQYNRVFGYYIEVTRSNYALVPEHYQRRQTLANAERYTTPELTELERKAINAAQDAQVREGELYVQVVDRLKEELSALSRLAQGFKTLDALQSLAQAAREHGYQKPTLNQEGRLSIKEGRHPVVECALPEGEFVPNDAELDLKERVLIITGPNMAGKSTYLRQVALIALMAHMGSFVPAQEADIPLLDNCFTRIGAQDDLASGQSTFMVEMSELSQILRQATPNTLVILDEIGRGTGTLDGLSIAWATVEYLADPNALGAMALFATHYHELSGMEGALPGVVNLSVLTREMGEEVVFLHKIKRGAADKSFGVYVANMAGVPEKVVRRAREILARLEASDITQDAIGQNILETRKKKHQQVNLMEVGRVELVEELARLDVLQMSPMEALNQLFLLKEKARKL